MSEKISENQAWAEWMLFGVGVLVQLLWAPHAFFADDILRIQTLESLLSGNGAPANFYSVVGPLFATPLVLLDKGLSLGAAHFWVLRFNVLCFAVGSLAFYVRVWPHASPHVARRMLLLLLLCSMFGQHFIYFYGEVFSAVLVWVGLAAVVTERPVWGWTWVGLGVANTPGLVAGLGLAVAFEVLRTRRLRHLWGVVWAVALILLENTWRRGGPLVTGYEGAGAGPPGVMPYTGLPGFSYPWVFGLLSLLFSFGRGLAFFVPGLWLGLGRLPRGDTRGDAPSAERALDGEAAPRSRGEDVLRRLFVLCMLFVGGMLLVYGRWFAWHGAVFWGPRFFLLACVPAAWLVAARLEEPATSWRRSGVTLLALAASAYVGVNGHLYRFGDVPNRICRAADGAVCLYAPEVSPLFVHGVFPKRLDGPMKALGILSVLCFVLLGWRLVGQVLRDGVRAALGAWESVRPSGDWRL